MLKRLAPRCVCQVAEKQLGGLVWSAAWLRSAEPAAAATLGIDLSQLMVRAGTAAYAACVAHYGDSTTHWVILVGPGNNGGDGYVMARLARADGRRVTILAIPPSKPLPVEAANASRQWAEAGGAVAQVAADAPFVVPADADLIIDGLFGTGIFGAPRGIYARVIDAVNALPVCRFAIDVPSGLDAETGAAPGACFRADETITFITLKPGLLTGQARAYVGGLTYATLGLDSWLAAPARTAEAQCRRATAADLAGYFGRPRLATAHKGSNGKVLLVGGARGFGGAILMAAEASLASGAGLTRVLTDTEHVTPLLTRAPEAMYIAADSTRAIDAAAAEEAMAWADVIAVGPGLGQGLFGRSAVEATLRHARANPGKTYVLDADALNLLPVCLAADPVRIARSVITPHPGEAARLLGTSIAAVEADRFAAAERLAACLGGVCILKGPGTVVHRHTEAGSGGGGTVQSFTAANSAIVDAGNAGMATGGMGDVLTGVVASIAAQGVTDGDVLEAAIAGALAHAVAADLVVAGRGVRGLRSIELIPRLPECFNAGADQEGG